MSAVKDTLEMLSERIGAQAGVRKVYGDPITVEGRTLIPIAKVRFGFGAGAGRGKRPEIPNENPGGGGGGMHATPAGVLEVTGSTTRFIRFNGWEPIAVAAGIGFVAGALLARLTARR
jgi:uncharacterized spore protein YtfJ